ncbi:protein of unknown function [Clostridium cavendishii DSM 21758]|uniref:DUF4318 domain-containing protein n=1 Tax=Clostridium cavendishii DSM 21758 TaxID=1121302 RepID=A0A1M6R8F1_9CLOT|nr:DUF4318 domain-containing protein [Clostridium cavendishii]SHK28741.1 protein of unknown function [Clostridium cavendishii DSM 21758]
MSKIVNNLLKKAFYIDLEDSLNYPSPKKICEAVTKYCIANKETFEIIKSSTPVTFRLDNTLYEATVGMARGGYILHCKEI